MKRCGQNVRSLVESAVQTEWCRQIARGRRGRETKGRQEARDQVNERWGEVGIRVGGKGIDSDPIK